MDIEAVGTATTTARQPQPMGVSADLAEARRQLRSVTTPQTWEAVMDEVHAVQAREHVSLLSAMHTVYAKLASGWTPQPR